MAFWIFLIGAIIAVVLYGLRRKPPSVADAVPPGAFGRTQGIALQYPAFERLPEEPKTKPKQLSWRQREILRAACNGRLIIPTITDYEAGAFGDAYATYQRRPVGALLRAEFLEYTPQGYKITPAGIEGLEKLPERSN